MAIALFAFYSPQASKDHPKRRLHKLPSALLRGPGYHQARRPLSRRVLFRHSGRRIVWVLTSTRLAAGAAPAAGGKSLEVARPVKPAGFSSAYGYG
jgi:hypothetical protein